MNGIGLMIYADTTISEDTIKDLRLEIKQQILPYMEDNCDMHIDDPYAYKLSLIVDNTYEGCDALIDILDPFVDTVMRISVNERLLELRKTKDSDRLIKIIDAMVDTVFEYTYPLIIHIADVDNMTSRDSIDHDIHRYLHRTVHDHAKIKFANIDADESNQPVLIFIEYDELDYLVVDVTHYTYDKKSSDTNKTVMLNDAESEYQGNGPFPNSDLKQV